ncbi:Der GTPase-activating protein YihI [Rodentibacter caecimuris]|uniref:Der GTPase-activating protein YihI n=1 Tax=Rodentibacter caecimuris TaxID=1796644 RepID=A0ABX3KWD6_9PAST|nr:GTPase-activating protein [Rodentibacter heylii]
MARKKKTRRLTDIMPVRKTDKKPELAKGKKLSRYELDTKAREEKRKRKHKGLAAGSRHSAVDEQAKKKQQEIKDPRIGSRKKVPLIVEFVNKPEKGITIPPLKESKTIDPTVELERLENNEILNELLDALEEGKILSQKDQLFVDECLNRIAELMQILGIEQEESEDDLYRAFEKIDINQFK